MLVTLLLVVLLALVLVALVLTGPIASKVGSAVGVDGAAVTAWDIAKWPVLLVVVLFMIGLLYYASPNAKLRGFKSITPGSLLAVVVWLLASATFAFYVANFSSYNKAYGALGGVIVFLLWLWITNVAILLGAELNAELERSRELKEGAPGAEREIQLEERSRPKAKSGRGRRNSGALRTARPASAPAKSRGRHDNRKTVYAVAVEVHPEWARRSSRRTMAVIERIGSYVEQLIAYEDVQENFLRAAAGTSQVYARARTRKDARQALNDKQVRRRLLASGRARVTQSWPSGGAPRNSSANDVLVDCSSWPRRWSVPRAQRERAKQALEPRHRHG